MPELSHLVKQIITITFKMSVPAQPAPVPPPFTPNATPGLPTLLRRVLAVQSIAEDIAQYAFLDFAIETSDENDIPRLLEPEDAFFALGIPEAANLFCYTRLFFADSS
ncbi:hypothetical protein CLAFUW4_10705 [Fulvia fulva]|uniref:Uncharacterized protein n=1 Tax=Passalora fulva TaxID=5499 RepID=A0A9Q8P7J1_PASFU|nr:uncharacterized protein CLAFUR5_05319 [Fulvia fulva]KAK4615361.1 hypothetical protein CLAFUR4_10710 [Fulvia fulva]KAK4616617.1 hypothetical protein CLAFUR0_10716 [Fulvia fulva]UJO15947.1 hypothetical protein CLAFUR5_05319 [Fulvia fulva]WPV19702.1 hypothetical protein CLAFUW4_10705 [Fulvia fulva]WPV33780.1 hypothetical protein CLAFUW7_10707 [Fulvia fulva]